MVQSDEDKQQAGEITEKKTEFQKLRQEHYNHWVAAFNNYNKYLITLSAGAIGLSITLLSIFDKNNSSINDSWWLAIAWVCWSVTMILVLLSFTLSTNFHSNRVSEYSEEIEILEGKIITDEERRERDKKRKDNTSLSSKIDKFGWIALGTFCVGIICAIVTVSIKITILLVIVYVVIGIIIYKERKNL